MPDTWTSGDYRPQSSVLLIADPGIQARAGQEALAVAGARTIGPIAFADAATALADASTIDAVLIEAIGSRAGSEGYEALGHALDAASAWLATSDAAIIIVFDDTQIDDVTARLLVGRVQLLCMPTAAERVTALVLALAGHGDTCARGRVRQDDDDRTHSEQRLSQLNAEVARIAETLARLAKAEPRDARPAMFGDRVMAYRGPDASAQASDGQAVSASEIRRAIRGRRLRDQYFGAGLFEDPAWDMLLDLCAADLERGRVSVSSLCIAAAVAPTTALRWISRMTEAGLFEREADPFDRRRAYMQLSTKARDGMHEYWRAVTRAGTMIA